ncbi:MAG: response regulator [Candidatus Omnitrophota bacterium]
MKKHILVVDDDPTSNALVSLLLKANEFDVSVATDGEEGLEKAGSNKPDLIVLDVMMPKMDGYTFLRKLKQINALAIPPVIMLTSKDKMEETFKLEGVAAYFVKPLETDKFLTKVIECLK